MSATAIAARPSTPSTAPRQPAPPAPRHCHRDRDFGIGYGNSSGYGRDKRYVSDWGQSLFRFR